MFSHKRPQNHEVISPCGHYKARVVFGEKMPSAITSGYGSPYYKTKIYFADVREGNREDVIFSEDAEKAQVAFSDNDRYLEIVWEIAGCIYSSSGTRYWRKVFETSNRKMIAYESSDFNRDIKTSSDPNLPIRVDPSSKSVLNTRYILDSDKSLLLGGFFLGVLAWFTGRYWILIFASILVLLGILSWWFIKE